VFRPYNEFMKEIIRFFGHTNWLVYERLPINYYQPAFFVYVIHMFWVIKQMEHSHSFAFQHPLDFFDIFFI